MARLIFERDRRNFLITRAHVRTMLSRYAQVEPAEWRFIANVHGRPEILDRPAGVPDLRFNLSHSGQWLLLAVTTRREVGIDVERRVLLQDYEAVGATCFAEEELSLLRGTNRAQQRDLFYRMWTRKEAWGKATGTGLASGGPAVTPAFPDGWTGVEFDCCPGYAAAMVVEGEIWAVREFEFETHAPA